MSQRKITVCRISDCGRATGVPGTARGLCNSHYLKLRRYGDPLASGLRDTTTCKDCGIVKTAENSYADANGRVSTRCRKCHLARGAEYAKDPSVRVRDRATEEAWRRRVGILSRTERGAVRRARRPRLCSRGHDNWSYREGDRRVCKTCKNESAEERRRLRGAKPRRPATGRCPSGHPLIEGNLRTGRHAGSCALCHRLRERRRYDQTAREWAAILINDPCAYCGCPGGSLDHIDPVSRGGDDSWLNLTAACKRCNSSKRDTPLLAFLMRRAVTA